MIRRKKKVPLEPVNQQRELIEFEGKRYYKLERDETIKKSALHKHFHGKRFNRIKQKHTVGKKPEDFTDRYFYNPLPKKDIKKEKFKIEMLYDVE